MDIKELQEKDLKQLHKLLVEKREEVRELTFKVHERQLTTVHKLKATKKDIARILTVINQKRIARVIN